MLTLADLKVGTHFRKWDGQTGVVLHTSFSWVTVKLDGMREPDKTVTFNGSKGDRTVTFPGKETGIRDLAPGTEIIEVLEKSSC